MSYPQGQLLSAPISNGFDGADFGTHISYLGTGGYREVPTLADRDAIAIKPGEIEYDGLGSGLRRVLMIVGVQEDRQLYILDIPAWDNLSDPDKLTALQDNGNWSPLATFLTGNLPYARLDQPNTYTAANSFIYFNYRTVLDGANLNIQYEDPNSGDVYSARFRIDETTGKLALDTDYGFQVQHNLRVKEQGGDPYVQTEPDRLYFRVESTGQEAQIQAYDPDGNGMDYVLLLKGSHLKVDRPPTEPDDIVDYQTLESSIATIPAVDETNLVHKTGTESIAGQKTFTSLTYFNGDCDGAAVGPVLIKANGGTSVGTSVTLDAQTIGGKTYSFISTGVSGGLGPGLFAVYVPQGVGYVMTLDSSGNMYVPNKVRTGYVEAYGGAPGGGASLTSNSDVLLGAGATIFWGNTYSYANGVWMGYNLALTTKFTISVKGNNSVIDDQGNWGINTLSPSNKLEVNGDIKATGKLKGDGSEITNIPRSAHLIAETIFTVSAAGNQSITVGYPPKGLVSLQVLEANTSWVRNIWKANATVTTASYNVTIPNDPNAPFAVGDKISVTYYH